MSPVVVIKVVVVVVVDALVAMVAVTVALVVVIVVNTAGGQRCSAGEGGCGRRSRMYLQGLGNRFNRYNELL